MKDFLEQLAEIEVRDPPPEFDRQLHERLNRLLLAQHLADFLLGGVPWAIVHFFRGVVDFFAVTLTGKNRK
jgi:hypothetical protein